MKFRIFGLLLVSFILAVLAVMTDTIQNPSGSGEPANPVSVPLNGDSSFKDLKIN